MSHNFQVLFLTASDSFDVTDTVKKLFYFKSNNQIIVPSGEVIKKKYFSHINSDITNVVVILQSVSQNSQSVSHTFDTNDEIIIDLKNSIVYKYNYTNLQNDIFNIHKKFDFKFGNIRCEFPEQIMAKRFITPERKVLEIGGNIGRNSLLISYILSLENNDHNLVVLESDADSAKNLEINRNCNNMKFHIEPSALSKHKLIQKGWHCFETTKNELPDGYKWVNIINYIDLMKKYQIAFDTLVLDCEGAFYKILLDFPDILNNVSLIIIENDFNDIKKKQYVDSTLEKNNFVLIYNTALNSDKIFLETGPYFYQVWKIKE